MVEISNAEVVRIFYEIAEMLDILGENRFKSAAYRRVAKTVEVLPVTLREIYSKGGVKALRGIPGVGEAIAEKIQQLVETGKLDYYEHLKSKIPAEVGALMKVPGIGPRKIMRLSKELGIKNIAQLEKAAKQGKIAKLKGFGEESEKDILDAIELSKISKGRIPLKEAEKMAKPIITKLKKLKEAEAVETAGSLRRKKVTVGDIDILASSRKPGKIIDTFVGLKDVKKVLGKGETKATVILKSGVQADLRVVPPESWGAALLYFIGSKNYNIELRKIAIKKGYKLSEYGLFDVKTGKMVAGKTELEVLKKLGQKYLKPEEREW